MAKTQQLQIRVSASEKAALKRYARQAGVDVSAYVLSRALPAVAGKVREVVGRLAGPEGHKFALAELNDLLVALPGAAFGDAVESLDVRTLTPFLQNYVAAMVEQAAHQKAVPAPVWAGGIEPLDAPWFVVPFPRLRPHLLRASPVAFKRRNLFVDAGVGDRV